MTKRFKQALLAAGSMTAFAAQPAYAQPATAAVPPAADSGALQQQPAQTQAADTGIQDIVVTAQRREERLQDVPISVAAFSPVQLRNNQLSTIQDLVRVAPGASRLNSRGDPTALLLSLRGVPTSVPSILQDSSVGVYVNGIYIARTQGQGLGMIDMSGVEVLSGPQGTLFGRNTIGGALNLTTQRPTTDLGGYVSATYGNFDTMNVEAVANLPVSSNLAVRLLYSHQQHDGYLNNTNPRGQDAFALNAEIFRGSLLFTPDDSWEISIVGDYLTNNSANLQTNVRYVEPAIPTSFLWQPATTDIFTVNSGQRDRLVIKNGGVAATISKTFDSLTVKSISGYRNLKSLSPNATLPGRSPGAPFTSVPAGDWIPLVNVLDNGIKFYDSYSQELQVYGTALDGRLNYIAGGYYFQERGRDGFAIEALAGISFPINLGPGAGVVLVPLQSFTQNTFVGKNRSLGGFAQVTYNLTDTLRLTGGLRYTKDTREVTHGTFKYAAAGGFRGPATTCVLPPEINPRTLPTFPFCEGSPPKVSDSFIPWNVVLDYKTPGDTLLYAKVARGFRSGGQGPGGAADPAFFAAFSPEKLTSYEVGVKGDLLDRRVRFSTAGYYSTYKNVQQFLLQVPRNGRQGIPIILNSGDARIYGGELTLTVAPVRSLRFNGALGYTNAKYTDGPFKDGGAAYAGGPNFLPNAPYNYVPKWTASVGGDYDVDIGSTGTLTLHADYSYRSRVFYSRLFAGFPQFNANLSQPGFALVNALATLDLKTVPLTISVYGKNVFNKRFVTAIQEGFSLGAVYQYPGEPRTYGLTVKYRFGD